MGPEFDSLHPHQAYYATLAQLVERGFRKAEVCGSNPQSGSIFTLFIMKLVELKRDFFAAIHSRMFIGLWILLFIQALAIVILALTHPHSGLTVQVHCDIASLVPVCNSAEASWTYIFNFAIFAVLVFIIDMLASLRLYTLKGRRASLAFLWFCAVIMTIITALVIGILHTMGY